MLKKWKIGWGITARCNMNCPFCYSKNHRIGKSDNMKGVIPFIEKNYQFIDSINFGTGETALLDEWWDLILMIKNLNDKIKIGVTTNGSLFCNDFITPRKVNLGKTLLNDVDISIDFAHADLHNHYRGNKNAFKWALETIKICNELGIEKTIVMVATKDSFTKENIKGMSELSQQYKCNLRINIYRPTTSENDDFLLPKSQFYDSLSYMLSMMKVISISDPLLSALIGEQKYEGDFTGKSSFRILDDGFITPSTYLITDEWKHRNIFCENDLDLGTLSFEDSLSNIIPCECNGCDVVEYCRGGAFDRRLLWYKTLERKDPYCPRGTNSNQFMELIKRNIEYKETNVSYVHDGYLPTIILGHSYE